MEVVNPIYVVPNVAALTRVFEWNFEWKFWIFILYWKMFLFAKRNIMNWFKIWVQKLILSGGRNIITKSAGNPRVNQAPEVTILSQLVYCGTQNHYSMWKSICFRFFWTIFTYVLSGALYKPQHSTQSTFMQHI